jgi:hypothetical protein
MITEYKIYDGRFARFLDGFWLNQKEAEAYCEKFDDESVIVVSRNVTKWKKISKKKEAK